MSAVGCYAPHRPLEGEKTSTDGSTGASTDSTGTTVTATTGTTASSTVADSSDATDASTTSDDTDASSTSVGGDACGNGVMEGSELCDDGDRIDGNGCNNDCVPSGTEIWTVVYDGAAHLDDSAQDIAVASDDSIVVVGWEGAEPDALALVHRYDTDGEMIWQTTFEVGNAGGVASGVAISATDDLAVSAYDATASAGLVRRYDLDGGVDDELPLSWPAFDVVVDEDDVLYVCGRVDAMPGPWHGKISAYSAFGNLLWDFEDIGATQSQVYGLSLSSPDIVAVSDRDHVGTVERRDADGQSLWSRAYPDFAWAGVAASPTGRSVIGGNDGVPNAAVTALDEDGVIEWMDLADQGQAFGAGITTDLMGNVILVGAVYNNAFGSDALIMKYDVDGNLLWSQHWDVNVRSPMDGTQAIAVAVDGTNAIIVTGDSSVNDGPTDLWIRRLTQ
ncbi:MAG TPA: hypothetical protein VG755_39260 [Nannocystaceae bacterium]|nr:hypothetical protein [Nannocystaceae bacterium]